MVGNPVQFAVVREDPEVETELLRRHGARGTALLVASGGCTALTLRNRFPDARLTLLEPNPAQIDLIRRKLQALHGAERARAFGIGSEDPAGLTACGNFESLFRGFREFLYEFVLDRADWLRVFAEETARAGLLERVFAAKYWPVAFELFYSDPLLLAMFGPEAVQHAPPGSYPAHFRRVLERGLRRDDAPGNYFLHHIFLGHYLEGRVPAYLGEGASQRAADPEFLQLFAQEVPSYSGFDLVSLSNIFDWTAEDQVRTLAARLSQELRDGAWVLFRQLNHAKDFRSMFGEEIQFDAMLSAELHRRDRSLFYSSLSVGRKIGRGAR